MKRIETVKLYPTHRQVAVLQHILHITRHLNNAALQERKDAYRRRKISITGKMQYRELTELRHESYALASVYRENLDAVLHRVDLAFAAFFRRVACGATPGFPRYRSAARWRQIEFPHGNRALKFDETQTRLRIPGLDWTRVRKGRDVPAFGRAWLVRKADGWYAQFECERQAMPLPPTGADVGLDRGVCVLVATSDGELFENPRPIERARLRVARAQRIVAKRKRGGKNRRKAVAKLARLHDKVARQRRDRAHKVSRSIVDRYDRIALEELRLVNMTRSAKGTQEKPGRNVGAKAGLNRSLLDAGFGMIANLIVEKAASAARTIRFVDAAYTSQTCFACGQVSAGNRSGLRFACLACGYSAHADVNAARVILKKAEWRPSGSCVALADGEDPSTVLALSGPQVTSQDAA